MNSTFTQDKLEAIRRGLSAVSLVADELEVMGMEIPANCAKQSEKRIDGYTIGLLSDTLRAAENSASGALEWLGKEAMK